MSINTTSDPLPRRTQTAWPLGRVRTALTILLAAVVLASIATLEARFVGLSTEEVRIGETPVTVTRLPGTEPAPPVVLVHGFAGSRQMMDQIAVSLARQGFLVASVDLPGHGQNGTPLSPRVNSLDGTTAQLVQVVEEVAEAVATWPETAGPLSYVGHSMATDVIIRAAEARSDVGGIVAISMYSPAVTATSPAALLVLSGATERHLREAGLDAMRLVDPAAAEGQTVAQGDVIRRTSVAPLVGHVGVLYADTSLEETTRWLREVTGLGQVAPLDRSGWIAGVLLVALVLLVWPLSAFVPKRGAPAPQALSWRGFAACLLLPILPALAIAALPAFGLAGYAAFGSLAAIFGVWGLVQIALLYRAGLRIAAPDLLGTLIYLALALAFALALDRYGAAFLPTGDRAPVMLGLFAGTLPLMLADRTMVQDASLLRRLLARLALLAGLSGALALSPAELALAFTTLPVLLLFLVVYGTMARWIAARRGPSGVAIGAAFVLAWAIAASTPLFSAAGLS